MNKINNNNKWQKKKKNNKKIQNFSMTIKIMIIKKINLIKIKSNKKIKIKLQYLNLSMKKIIIFIQLLVQNLMLKKVLLQVYFIYFINLLLNFFK